MYDFFIRKCTYIRLNESVGEWQLIDPTKVKKEKCLFRDNSYGLTLKTRLIRDTYVRILRFQ